MFIPQTIAKYRRSNNKAQWNHANISTPDDNHNGYHTNYNVGTKGTWHCKLIGDEWVVHHDSEPAVVQDDTVWFFYEGINVSINDMPIDDEAKVILTLKYQEETHHNFGGYASYSS